VEFQQTSERFKKKNLKKKINDEEMNRIAYKLKQEKRSIFSGYYIRGKLFYKFFCVCEIKNERLLYTFLKVIASVGNLTKHFYVEG